MGDPFLVRLGTVASTQEVARDLPLGSVVVAQEQTGGRGRLGRHWMAPRGTALLCSFVVGFHPLASLAAGVAAAEACGEGVLLKWPNDLLLEGRKLGGILVEASLERAVIGIGINLTWAPPGSACLGEDPDPLLSRLRRLLPRWLASDRAELLQRWRELSDTLGRQVMVELPGRRLTGLATDIGNDGALIVAGERVTVGDVVHLRPGPGELGRRDLLSSPGRPGSSPASPPSPRPGSERRAREARRG